MAAHPGRRVVVVDLDGTLANVDHRRHFLWKRPKDWAGFHRACVRDKPNLWCVALIRAFQACGLQILIVTARSVAVKEETEAWLKRILGDMTGVKLIMLRPEGEFVKDVDLKRRWLRQYGRRRILFAVEDRGRVVKMWREEGVACLQCDDWEEREAIMPPELARRGVRRRPALGPPSVVK